MIRVTHFTFGMRSGFINRMWLAIAISFFSYAVSAETYPLSGVWVAKDDRFPGSTAGACLLLKEFGVDAVLTQPFPRLMIFPETSDLKCREIFRPKEQSSLSRVQRTAAFKSLKRLASAGYLFPKDRFLP